MHTKTAILVRIIWGENHFSVFSKNLKKENYEKEGQDIHIVRISTTFECQKVSFLIFPHLIRQSAAIAKTKIEVFIKNLD